MLRNTYLSLFHTLMRVDTGQKKKRILANFAQCTFLYDVASNLNFLCETLINE